MMRTCDYLAPVRRSAVAAMLVVLAACGSGSETGNAGDGGNPGSGGGPGGPGGAGNPLDIVLDFTVANDASEARTETVLASVPFPFGGYQPGDLANMVVSGHQTAWLPLQYWADGRVKVAQAQFTDEFAAGEQKDYVVARDEASLTGAFQRNAWVAQMIDSLELGAEVRDTFQVGYRGFATGAGEVMQSTPLIETRRYHTFHDPMGAPGIGRDYLTSTFYVTEYRDMPFVMVDWVVGNDYLGADSVPGGNSDPNLEALGSVDVRAAHFLCKGASAIMPYRASKSGIESEIGMSGGYRGFRVMNDTWIADAQTRRYRFLLRFEPSGASAPELNRWQATARSMMSDPMLGLASQQAWQLTGAAGLVGGPIEGPGDANARAIGEYQSWEGQNWFGTWGGHGDAQATATTGTPRNHPLSPELAHAIQGHYPKLLFKLEQMAWAQAMRPYHLWGVEVGAEQQILLWDGIPMLIVPGEHLGRKQLRDSDPYPQYRTAMVGQHWAHGWNPYDHEHWSSDLLFDYWTVSGDAWAKAELRNLGQSLKGTMRLQYYYTSGIQAARAEGWCMQGFAQCYQATQDESLKTYAMRRVNEIIDVQRRKDHPSKAILFQGNYPNTQYPLDHKFFMPWQHGAVLYGFLGAYHAFGEPKLLEIAEDVVDTVEYSWVTNITGHPTFGFVAQGLRYYTPAEHNGVEVPANYWDGLPVAQHLGDSPLGGAHSFLIGGLHMLADMTSDQDVRSRALFYGGMLRGNVTDNDRWNKWYACLPRNHVATQ